MEEIPETYVAGHRLSERQISIKHAPVDMSAQGTLVRLTLV
ncbi:hypothetical protein FEM21_06910 [Flavobacterium seoulense]|uniref:Uncharacterized protein n=1 Tax=Flavobacterium seoulense TaxID=1492738 RepID=A0A066WYX5_9FLAO|nr:hypothetical protein FEM21_06910 [Flavobacterium seoulense]